MVKQTILLMVMVISGVAVYGFFYRPELAVWRDALLALLKNLFQ